MILRNLVMLGFLLLVSLSTTAQTEILGTWLTQDKEAKVEFYKSNGKYYGKIIWLKNPTDEFGKPFTDVENPDKALQLRQLMNLVILSDFEYDDNEWIDGTLYDPNKGSTYNSKIWLEDNKTLKVRGYIGFLYETETWTKL
jgi:uncharacterized protein (DUF2147 family)